MAWERGHAEADFSYMTIGLTVSFSKVERALLEAGTYQYWSPRAVLYDCAVEQCSLLILGSHSPK